MTVRIPATLVSLLLLASCSDKASTSSTHTIVSDVEVSKKLELLDRKVSQDLRCEDYEIARELLSRYGIKPALIAADMPEDCPQGAKELIQRLQTTLKDAKDFHLELSLPYQLSAVTPPVITNCQDWKECEAAIGSYLYPVQSSFLSDSLYAYLKIDSRLVPLRILSSQKLSFQERLLKLIREKTYGHSVASNLASLSLNLFTRSAMDDKPKDDLVLQVEDLTTGLLHTIETSYTPPRKKGFELAWETEFLQADLYRFFPCFDSETSTFAFGSCRDQETGYLWGLSWSQEIMDQMTELAADPAPPQHIVFDMRSNGGGDPSLVARFICMYGDARTRARLADIGYRITRMPKTIRNRSISELLPTDNEDFFVSEDQELRDISLLERSNLTQESCEALHVMDMDHTQWIVLTNGTEFSAAEVFLEIIKGSSRFKIVGARTRGGSGSPVWFTLPNTRIKLRLSVARLIDLKSGQMLIEGQGVAPDFPTTAFGSTDFTARLKGMPKPPDFSQLMSMLKKIQNSLERKSCETFTVNPVSSVHHLDRLGSNGGSPDPQSDQG